MTFNEFWPVFLEQKKVVAKKTTIAAYTLQWEKHLSSVFGNINLNDVKNSTLQKYVNDSYCSGRHTKVLKDEITLIKNILKTFSILEDKPCYMPIVVWPSKSKTQGECKKREKYSDAEIKLIIDYCRNSPIHWHKAIALACVTGARVGEIAGIRFSDFDFDKKQIHICRTVGRLYEGAGKTELYVNSTKTECSNRFIPVPDWLCDYYRSYKKLYNISDSSYITRGDASEFIEPRTLRAKFKLLCKKIGVDYKTFHSLRHSYASRLLLNGVDARTAAELLGHSDVAMTLNVYSHSDDSAKQLAAKKAFL